MSYPYTVIDAFTDAPFGGNPAAVFPLEAPRPDEWMQLVAREMNCSETAFFHPEGEGYRLRWFTPTVEVPLCGHATLASAHWLHESGRLPREQTVRFFSLSGELRATADGEWIALDFPLRQPTRVEEPPALAAALGVEPLEVWQHGTNLLALLPSGAAVRSLSPDIAAIKTLDAVNDLSMDGVIVTAEGDAANIDFVSRYFAPAKGIDEDPVTGGAHCMLAPFWADRLRKRELTGYQASARGGMMRVHPEGDRVRLLGQAVTVARCELVTA
jgi:PhzF family phenazine biosynthesis protein